MSETFGGDVVPSISIANLLNQRDAVLGKIRAAIALLQEAGDLAAAARLLDEQRYRGFLYVLQGSDRYRHTTLLEPNGIEEIEKRLDAGAWDRLMNDSGLMTFMDSKAREQWRKDIDELATPALNERNITSTFESLYGARGEMFERGVIRCFKALSWNYKTNQPFKFGKRVVISYLRSRGDYGSFNHRALDELADLQRCLSILDGKPEEDHRVGISARLREAALGAGGYRSRGTHADTYLSIRWFLNGNGHITFRRSDLVEKMNRILAKHFPQQLAHDHHT